MIFFSNAAVLKVVKRYYTLFVLSKKVIREPANFSLVLSVIPQ